MLEHMKKLLTNDHIELIMSNEPGTKFIIPKNVMPKFFEFIEPFQVNDDEKFIPADEFFKDFDKKYGKVGIAIRGYRSRDGITQIALAKKMNIRQNHLSQMENGKRTVGKAMARKLAAIFNTNYRMFL